MNSKVLLAIATALLLALAGAAQAVDKTYDSNSTSTDGNNWYPACGTDAVAFGKAPASIPDGKCGGSGVGGDRITFSQDTTPPVVTADWTQKGSATIADNSTGTVTLENLLIDSTDVVADFGPSVITGIFGPGAFIFITTTTSKNPAPGQTGTGSTAPGGSVTWGILTGWNTTGENFCVGSPTTICDNNGFTHGQTTPGTSPSPTYDLGTWSFDATTGDFEGSSYIDRVSNGGTSNTRFELRGAFKGSSLPALPLVGFGVLALGLGTLGLRTLVRKK